MSTPRQPLSLRKRLLFSALTLVVVLAGIEGAARLIEPGDGALLAEASSPMVFQQLPEVALREYSGAAGSGLTFHDKLIDHHHQAIPVPRAEGELRVVLLGGSALAGSGLPRLAGPASVAQRALDAAFPDRSIRVFNLGRSGYGSAQVAWLFEQVADAIQPDLVLTVMGNNERLDIANVLHLQPDTRAVLGSRLARRSLAVGRLLRPLPVRGEVDPDGPAPVMPHEHQVPDRDEVDAYIVGRLGRSLGRIHRTARRVDAPLVVATVPVNRRYEPYGHEWFFLHQEVGHSPAVRLAHWAQHYEGHEHALRALEEATSQRQPHVAESVLLAVNLRLDGRLGDVQPYERSVREWLDAQDDEGISSEDAILASWALGHLDSPEVAAARIAPWVERLGRQPRSRGDTCQGADMLFHAGSVEQAAQEYARCLLSSMYFRADDKVNAVLRRWPGGSVRAFDLEAEVRARAPHDLPGYEYYLDYCHYNSRGAVLVGHLLATEIAAALKLGDGVVGADEAVAAHDAARAGRPSDLPDVEQWAGAGFDPSLLVALPRAGAEDRARDNPDWSRALAEVYRGNELAQAASVANLDAAQQAAAAWRDALYARPAYPPALRNLAWLQEQGLTPP